MTVSNSPATRLTRFASASLPELFTISLPLMMASLSGLLMSFCDRIILARYSTDAMNAAVTASMAANVFTLGALGIAVIAEVFVGKRNGAGERDKAAEPTWQMIWFSLATSVMFVPCALWLSPYVVPAEQFQGQAVDYFRIWMLFGAFFPMAGALSAFFIGIGHVKIITVATVISNLTNIVLDFVFIFGVGDLNPSLGVRGAALATGIAQALQVVILGVWFLQKSHRETYRTDNFRLQWALFKDCLKLGCPSAVGHMIEIAAWAFILRLMATEGPAHITTLAIGQNLTILFAFLSQGLQKGVLAVAANLVGAKTTELMPKLIRSALLLIMVIGAVLFVPLVVYPDPIVNIFLLDDGFNRDELFAFAKATGLWVWLYILLDGTVWIMAGVLTAYADTKFIMVANAVAAWCLAVAPTYVVICLLKSPPQQVWTIMNLYALLNALFFVGRAMILLTRRPFLVVDA